MSTRYLKIGLTAGIVLAALGLYWKTLAPTATLVDSGELITACAKLDMGHPPGFPLYILVGWLFSHLPVESVAVRLNFMSAAFGALASGAVFWLSVYALELKPESAASAKGDRKAGRKIQRASAAPTPPAETPGAMARPVWEILLPSAVAALTFVASNTLWSYATLTEVYTLSTFLIVLVLCLVLRWAQAPGAGPDAPSAAVLVRRLYASAFVFGLALGVHHVSVGFLAVGIVYLLIGQRRYLLKVDTVLKSAGWLLLGFSVYLFLPIRAAQKPLLNWGDPSTLERLIWHVTGKQYQVNLVSTSLDRAMERLGNFLQLWTSEFTWLGFALLLLGLGILWRRQRRLFWFTLLMVAFNITWTTFYDIAEDNEAYGLPTFVLSAVWLAWGLRWIIEKVRAQAAVWAPAVALAGLLLPVLAIGQHYHRNDHSRYYVAYDYVHNVLDNVEENGVLLTLDWHLYSPLLYYQHVEKLRPDVTVIDVNLLRRSWYMDYMRRQYPWLIEETKEDVQAYLAQLTLFEHDQPYNPNVIQTRFVDMINHFIRASMAERPVYTTLSVQSERGVAQRLFWVPQGPVFRLYRIKPEYLAPGERRELGLRGLTDGSIELDGVAERIKTDYARMFINRGIYLTLYGLHEDALVWYNKALPLDPSSLDTYWKMAQSYRALGRTAEAQRAYQSALKIAPGNRDLQAEYQSLK